MVISFNGRANIAVSKVLEQYPDAKLYEVHGTPSKPITDPKDIDQLELIFFNSESSTVEIRSTGYSEFGEPELVGKPWLESIVIDWPIDMDLPEACQLKEKAGYTDPYDEVILRHIMDPDPNVHACFRFHQVTGKYVYVDVVTKVVAVGGPPRN